MANVKKIICGKYEFDFIENPYLPSNSGMIVGEKQTIMFIERNGKFEFWETPTWKLYSCEFYTEQNKNGIKINMEFK